MFETLAWLQNNKIVDENNFLIFISHNGVSYVVSWWVGLSGACQPRFWLRVFIQKIHILLFEFDRETHRKFSGIYVLCLRVCMRNQLCIKTS